MVEFRPPHRPWAWRWPLSALVLLSTAGPAVLLLLLSLSSSTISYELAAGVVTIRSGSLLDGSRRFELGRITDRRVVQLGRGSRRMGTAMSGACTGIWSWEELGPVWQATNCSRTGVLLTVAGEERPILVTPPDPEAFLALLAAGEDARIALPPPDVGVLRAIAAVGSLTALVACGVLVPLLLYGPRRLVYAVGEGRLEVRSLYSRRSWPARDFKARAHDARGAWRLAGTGMPGYYTGYFRQEGKSVTLYATSMTGGVLLEGPVRLYLTPEDRAGFLAALRAAGATVEE